MACRALPERGVFRHVPHGFAAGVVVLPFLGPGRICVRGWRDGAGYQLLPRLVEEIFVQRKLVPVVLIILIRLSFVLFFDVPVRSSPALGHGSVKGCGTSIPCLCPSLWK